MTASKVGLLTIKALKGAISIGAPYWLFFGIVERHDYSARFLKRWLVTFGRRVACCHCCPLSGGVKDKLVQPACWRLAEHKKQVAEQETPQEYGEEK